MDQVVVPAFAKINLTLDIKGKRSDGYHELESLMQQVDLHDEVTIRLNKDKEIRVLSDEVQVPIGRKNIAYRAAEELLKYCQLSCGLDIFIKKRIPIAGGMAGGSTNAAAVLTGLNNLLSLNLAPETLMQVGMKLGADVPYCVKGGTAIATGIGEILTPSKAPPQMWLVLVKPDFGVSTAEVYGNFCLDSVYHRPNINKVINGIETASVSDIYAGMGNVLESVTIKLHPVIADIKKKLALWGANYVLMSGSGPTICAFVSSEAQALELTHTAKEQLPASYQIQPTHTLGN